MTDSWDTRPEYASYEDLCDRVETWLNTIPRSNIISVNVMPITLVTYTITVWYNI